MFHVHIVEVSALYYYMCCNSWNQTNEWNTLPFHVSSTR